MHSSPIKYELKSARESANAVDTLLGNVCFNVCAPVCSGSVCVSACSHAHVCAVYITVCLCVLLPSRYFGGHINFGARVYQERCARNGCGNDGDDDAAAAAVSTSSTRRVQIEPNIAS